MSVSGSTKSFTFDLNGNMTGDGTRTFEWDAENRLLAVNQGTLRSEFSYDGESRRVRIVEKSGQTMTSDRRFLWGNRAICEERNSSGGTVAKRFFADGVQQAGQAFFYSRDHLGSVRELGDGAGAIKARYDYDPYGKRSAITEDQVADFGFTGHYEHSVSETTLALFRVYDARLGRWTSEDPAGTVDGPNLYVYASNTPVVDTDRLGLYVYSGTNRNYRSRIDDAMRNIYDALNDTRRCDCQSQLGPDIWTMLQPGHPPVVVVRDLGSNQWGGAQGGVIFLDPDSFDISRTGLCFLESVILHELGHIVRRDTHDNEPPDFFKACNLGCIQPGRVR